MSKQKRKIERMSERAEEYNRLSYSIPGMNFEQVRVDKSRNLDAPFVKWLAKLDEIERQIEKEKTKLDEMLVIVTSAIEAIDDDNYKSVLTYRYIDNLIWEDIADKLYVSHATVHRWHSAALDILEIPK